MIIIGLLALARRAYCLAAHKALLEASHAPGIDRCPRCGEAFDREAMLRLGAPVRLAEILAARAARAARR